MPPVGLLLGLGAALAWGLTDVAGALAGRLAGSLRVLAGTQLVGFAILVTIALIGLLAGRPAPAPEPGWLSVAAICGILAMIAYLAFFTALRIGPISIVSPTVAAYGGLTVVLAVVIRGETLAPIEIVGAIVATGGVMAVGFVVPEGGRFPRVRGPGVAFALVALVSFAVLTIILADPIRQVGWLPTMLVSRSTNVAAGLTLLAIALIARPRLMDAFVRTADGTPPRVRAAVGLMVAAGALDTAGLISFAIGLEIAPVWLVGLSSSLGPVVAVLYAVWFLEERPRPIQWAGLIAIGVGILLVGLP
jgi:drug/metabolite transporter (DMT)-like permease